MGYKAIVFWCIIAQLVPFNLGKLDKSSTECEIRKLAYEYALTLQPHRAPLNTVFDALELEQQCNLPRPASNIHTKQTLSVEVESLLLQKDVYVVNPNLVGNTKINCNDKFCEYASIHGALNALRSSSTNGTIVLRGGFHYLLHPILLRASDSGISFVNYPNEQPWISGGKLLKTRWNKLEVNNNGQNIWVTDVGHQVDDIVSLNLLNRRLTRARYPNANPEDRSTVRNLGGNSNILKWHKPKYVLPKAQQMFKNLTQEIGKTDSLLWEYNMYGNGKCTVAGDVDCPCGAWVDTFYGDDPVSESYWCSDIAAGGWSEMDKGNKYYNGPVLPEGLTYNKTGPIGVRAAKWANATDAIVVAWRTQGWFVNMYRVKTHDKASGSLVWDRWSGGWQGGRGWQIESKNGNIDPIPPFFVENIFEELDSPNEWFFDKKTRKLYYFQDPTEVDSIHEKSFIVPIMKELIGLHGKPHNHQVIKDVLIEGIGFRDTQITYMDRWGVPSGGDWALYRGGAIFIEGTENVTIKSCIIRRVDGNGIMLSGYNRKTILENNDFSFIGDTAMAAWGYTKEDDGRDGDYPTGVLVKGNIAREVGVFQLQSSMWFQAKSSGNHIVGNIFFNGPRSGINLNDGFGGGNVISNNLLFNQCRQSGDHGPINTWDRQNFMTHIPGTDFNSYEPAYNEITRNFLIANYGASQGVDNDDGSSRYNIHHNFVYGEGFKQDYGGHDSLYHHNVNIVHKYDGQNCINTGPFVKGHGDNFSYNRCVVLYTERYGTLYGCNDKDIKGSIVQYLAHNHYYTPLGKPVLYCGARVDIALKELQEKSNNRTEKGSTANVLPSNIEMIRWGREVLLMNKKGVQSTTAVEE